MKKQFTPWDLGATLYMPATRMDLAEVLEGKIPGLRSLVVCLEDAVSEHDVPFALQNLSLFLQRLNDAKFNMETTSGRWFLFAPVIRTWGDG
jgi:citrate lyase beta subunit